MIDVLIVEPNKDYEINLNDCYILNSSINKLRNEVFEDLRQQLVDKYKKIKLDNIMFIFQDGEYISNNGNGSCLDQFMCFYYRDLNKEVEIVEEDKNIKHTENYVDFVNLTDAEKFDYLYEMETRIIDKLRKVINK